MSTAIRILAPLALCVAAVFFLFGFLATLEPGVADAILWRIGYSVLIVVTLVTAARIAFAKKLR